MDGERGGGSAPFLRVNELKKDGCAQRKGPFRCQIPLGIYTEAETTISPLDKVTHVGGGDTQQEEAQKADLPSHLSRHLNIALLMTTQASSHHL
jgi:hypothetical protein